MDHKLVDRIADAVLYEGYILYPYRRSAIKNQQRFNFGVIYPREYARPIGESFSQQTECLVMGEAGVRLSVRVRFLHLLAREMEEGQPWQEAIEREVEVPEFRLRKLLSEEKRVKFHFYGAGIEKLGNEPELAGNGYRQQTVAGEIEVAARQIDTRLFKIIVTTVNSTPVDRFENAAQISCDSRDELLLHSLVSAHTILSVRKGEFVSLLDPPETLRQAAAACHNVGTWPVLVGEEGERGMMLSSPIILYDYPQIAPESVGNFFDGTEIDEMLTLRLLTLTDEEKRELREGDDRARQILERTETMPAAQLIKLHGAMRGLKSFQGGE
jgi:hypothetical protein